MASILVVGGSLGGLLVANLLLRAGHQVQVLERSARSLEGRGAGIVTHASLLEALRAAGAVVDDTLGVTVGSRVLLSAEGGVEADWPYPQLLSSWGRMHAVLRAALPDACYRLGAQVSAVASRPDGVTAQLVGGQTLQADLLIACDGIRSTVRAQLAPQVQPAYAGYVAWRGLCDEAALSRGMREALFGRIGFGLPDGEQMLGYPVPGADDATAPGQRRWNFVWYRPAAAGPELQALLTDADGVHHPEGIAPQQVSWRRIADVRQAARALLAPQFAEAVEKTAQPFLQPIFDLASPAIAFDRVALLGDAAFVARPHVGMGVTKAADDAVALADCIAAEGATPAALRRYEACRQPAGAAVIERARRLGAYLGAWRPGQGLRRDASSVLRETAIDPRHFAADADPHAADLPAAALAA